MRIFIFCLGLVLLLLAGCAPQVAKKQEPVFFPPPPNPPRVQYLLGIGTSKDVEGNEVETSLISLAPVINEEVKFFVKPYGIAVSQETIYVADTMTSQVAVINLVQKSFTWLKGNFGPGKLIKPVGVATDDDGNLYVTDTSHKKVFVYNHAGDFVRTYGETSDILPVSVAVDKRRVYVLDRNRDKIIVFSRNSGEVIEALGQSSDKLEDNLALPTNMALTKQGIFYVSNAGRGNIVSLDRDGHTLKTIGKMGDGFGQFSRPKGIAVDGDGRLYVIDAAYQNIQLFNEDGRLLMFFAGPGLPVGSLNVPAGLAVSDANLEFYQTYAQPDFELEQVVFAVSQVGRHKINIYGIGKKKDYDYEKYYRETQEILRKADENRAAREKESSNPK